MLLIKCTIIIYAISLFLAEGAEAIDNVCPANHTLPKVKGGIPALPGDIPWQARLEAGGHLCGAVIIDKSYLITAAHCVHENMGTGPLYDIDSVKVKVGSLYVSHDSGGEIEAKIAAIISHPSYNPRAYDYDYAVISLAEPLVFTKNITALCLPESCDDEPSPGTFCLISGWGITDGTNFFQENTLQKALAPIVSRRVCRQSLSPRRAGIAFTDRMLCAGFPQGGIDTCQGDSGGPLACRISSSANGSYFVLAGIVSFGSPQCGEPGEYGFYARTCRVFPWIRNTMIATRNEPTSASTSEEQRAPFNFSSISIPDEPGPVGDPKSLSFHVRVNTVMEANGNYHNCSGAIVENNWILTAASCVNAKTASDVIVKDALGSSLGSVSRIVVHRRFNSRTLKYNFALLKLQNSIRFSAHSLLGVFPNKIAFPKPCRRARRLRSKCIASGFGAIDLLPGEEPTQRLMVAKVSDLPKKRCKTTVRRMFSSRLSICVTDDTSQQAPCEVDEGGPMVCAQDDDSGTLQGIASIAPFGCNEPSTVVLYSRVCTVSRWIASTLFPR